MTISATRVMGKVYAAMGIVAPEPVRGKSLHRPGLVLMTGLPRAEVCREESARLHDLTAGKMQRENLPPAEVTILRIPGQKKDIITQERVGAEQATQFVSNYGEGMWRFLPLRRTI